MTHINMSNVLTVSGVSTRRACGHVSSMSAFFLLVPVVELTHSHTAGLSPCVILDWETVQKQNSSGLIHCDHPPL